MQFAPIDAGYNWLNETPQTTMYNDEITFQSAFCLPQPPQSRAELTVALPSLFILVIPFHASHSFPATTAIITVLVAFPSLSSLSHTHSDIWHGSVNQESASVITLTDDTSYDGKGYTSFGFEYEKNEAITWAVNATPSWQLTAASIGPNAEAQISQRLISEEPMSIILNLGM